jgi:hypothetical protein
MTFYKITSCFLFFSICFSNSKASIFPADNSRLHYTTVYFQENFFPGAKKYNLVLGKDSLFSAEDNALKGSGSDLPAFWMHDLEWGQNYFWRVDAFDQAGKKIAFGKVHAFKICSIVTDNFDEVKLITRTNKPGKYGTELIAADYARSIFNRDGKAMWTLPAIESVIDRKTQIRDLKMTSQNTITFLAGKTPIEIDFEGNVIWKGPDHFIFEGDTITFHHEFKKDNNGNYYILGSRFVYRKLLVKLPDSIVKNEDMVKITDTAVYRKIETSILLKLDKDNKLLWFWDSNDYLQDIDLNYKRSGSGFPNFSSHANAFSVNEEGTMAYVGFRDLSRLVKIEIKTKKVVCSYGEKYPSGEAKFYNNLFRFQHGANITAHNTLLILNNNNVRSGAITSVVEFSDHPAKMKDSVLLWKFGLNFDTLTNGKSVKGGNVEALQNSNLLVCAGELNRIFEVTRNKEVVWDAFIYYRTKKDTLWRAFSQYRASAFKRVAFNHFVSEVKEFKIKNNKVLINYYIHNTGNLSDSYFIEILNENNVALKKQKCGPVKENSFINRQLQVQLSENRGGKISVRVTSVGNPKITEKVKN